MVQRVVAEDSRGAEEAARLHLGGEREDLAETLEGDLGEAGVELGRSLVLVLLPNL